MIPEKLPKQVLEKLHKDHRGIVHLKAMVRSYIWWEGVDKDIESLVKSYQACQSVENSPPNAPIRCTHGSGLPNHGSVHMLILLAHSEVERTY